MFRYEPTPGKLTFLQQLLRPAKKILPLVGFTQLLSGTTRIIAKGAHRIQYLIEWGVDNPEYFDHYLDQYDMWHSSRNSLSFERGVFSNLAIQATTVSKSDLPEVLELCCADGYMTYYFYSLKSSKITGIDFDPHAISRAKRLHKASNIEYICGDIRYDLPDKKFENIVWDAAIEHFSESEIVDLMKGIKARLKPDGILSGYTIKEDHESGAFHLHQHEYEFHNKEDLARFFQPHFKNIQVIETQFPNRTNFYFFASDGPLPIDREIALTHRK
jgi:2-polyprenyl-3-methyl-5-hydroxy-6-metoxy-1,4-benzoquinol methylase